MKLPQTREELTHWILENGDITFGRFLANQIDPSERERYALFQMEIDVLLYTQKQISIYPESVTVTKKLVSTEGNTLYQLRVWNHVITEYIVTKHWDGNRKSGRRELVSFMIRLSEANVSIT